MKIMALELSSGAGNIAWLDEAEIRYQSEFANDRKHSGLFFENLHGYEGARPARPNRGCPRSWLVCGDADRDRHRDRIAIRRPMRELIGLPSLARCATMSADYVVIGDARRLTFWLARVSQRRCVEGPALCTERS